MVNSVRRHAGHRTTLASDQYLHGILLAVAASLVLSLGGVLVRKIEQATSWQIIFYRSIGLFLGLSILFAVRNRGIIWHSFSTSFSKTVVAGPFQGVASVFFVLALTHTTIANAMLLVSATPLIAACLGWLLLRERVELVTMFAMVGVAAGIALMTVDSIGNGMTLGSVFAIANALALGTYLVLLRGGSRVGKLDMLPASIIGAVIAGIISAIATESFDVSRYDLLLCFFWGAGLQTTGLALVIISARRIPAAALSLIVLVESVCGPIWVWLLIGEKPASLTIVGGTIMIVVVAIWSLVRIAHERRRQATDDKRPLI